MNEKMLKSAQELQRRMEKIQKDLEGHEIEGFSGGGLIKVCLNGKMDPQSVQIDKEVFADMLSEDVLEKLDLTQLEDLILVAIKDAKEKTESHVQDQMQSITGGLELPKF